MTQDKIETDLSRRTGPVRWVLFRLGAVLVALLPVVLLEVGLRLAVPGPGVGLEDPYVSFSGVRKLFVLDSSGRRYETAGERLDFFYPQSFPAEKAEDAFRIFCLGGSTVQGRPYEVETSFTTWLKLNLDAAEPDREWEMVNCGGISYASYRLVPIMRELLDYEPDLFIVYTGHNEFLEDRTYGHIKKMPPWRLALHRKLMNLRIYSLAHSHFSSRTASKPEKSLPTEVDAKLDFDDGIKWYHRDDPWRQGVIDHFGRNLDAMARMAHEAGIPIILANPVVNLADCPPIKSEPSVQGAEKQRADERRRQARQLSWDDYYGKLRLLEQAAAIDSRDAGLLYVIAKCYARIGRFDDAKKCYIKAKEEDICPLRILEPMRNAISDVAARYGVPLIDVQDLIDISSEADSAGATWLTDHVHPSMAGHRLIADAFLSTMENMGLVRPKEGWQSDRAKLWEEHLASLDDLYYRKAEARLKRLQIWSRGRIPDELIQPNE
ncbi:MAG: GDSL-type esterase/lipase family protein [Planctomycetota bacterium]|jgi:lysophospholipase L1-like esterase